MISPIMPRLSKQSIFFRSPYQNPVFIFPLCATRPISVIVLDFITVIIFGKEYK
jgi:hypothetical protein